MEKSAEGDLAQTPDDGAAAAACASPRRTGDGMRWLNIRVSFDSIPREAAAFIP